MAKHKLMAIGAHADDIEINVGGTLLKYHDVGYEIVYVLSTNNFSGQWSTLQPDGSIRREKPVPEIIEPQRKLEAARAAAALGTVAIHLDHPQRHYFRPDTSVAELRYGCPLPASVKQDIPSILTAYEHGPSVRALADLILKHDPEAVITHAMPMVDIEHFATSLLVTKAFWVAVKDGYTGMLLHWHDVSVGQLGEAYVKWDTHIDFTKQWQRKFDLIGVHACQIPIASNIDLPPWGLACGCEHAEVFNIVSRGTRPYQGTPFNFEILRNSGR